MKQKVTYFWAMAVLAIVLGILTPAPAHGQQVLFNIIQQADLSSSCDASYTDSGGAYGCCGSPGRRECARDLNPTKWFSTGCTDPAANVYYSAATVCDLPTPVPFPEPLPATAPASGTDFTFYVASDMHPGRESFAVLTQAQQVAAINNMGSQGLLWSLGGPGLPATPIAAPAGIWFAGDMTTKGADEELGQFRLMWEQGWTQDSIRYPVYVGLGNHDLYTENSIGGAAEMWGYIRNRMGTLNMDMNASGFLNVDAASGSHAYSRDWEGVHIVQMNTYPGDTNSLADTASTSSFACTANSPNPIGDPYQLCAYTEDSANWLKNDLANATASNPFKPIIIVQHFPYSSSDISSAGQANMTNILSGYNVIGVFVGHGHILSSETIPCLASPCVAGGVVGSMDEFQDGNSGRCNDQDQPCYSVTGSAQFIPVRVTQDYMDVATIGWTTDQNTFLPTTPAFETGFLPTGTGACRKRINTNYLDVTSYFTGGSNASNTYTNTSGGIVYGPVAARVGTASGDFLDSCGVGNSNNAYVILNGGLDIASGASITVSGASGFFRLVPMSPRATPASINISTTSASQPGQPILINPQTLILNGPPQNTVSVSVSYQGGLAGWLQFDNGSTTSVNLVSGGLGYVPMNVSFVPGVLDNIAAGVVNAVITVTYQNSGQSVAIPVIVNFRAPITVTLAPVAKSSPPQFTATLSYTPLSANGGIGQTSPEGVVELLNVPYDAKGNPFETVISSGVVNTGADCPYPKDTVLYGNPGNSGQCPSFQGTNLSGDAFAFPKANGVYYLEAIYTGPGNGGSPGPWSYPVTSNVITYIQGPAPALSLVAGNLQSAREQQPFALPITVNVLVEGKPTAGLMVTFSTPSSPALPGGIFAGGASQITVFTDASGNATIPAFALTANLIPGNWTLTATLTGTSQTLNLSLENLGAAQFPSMNAVITSQSGTLNARTWDLAISNNGPGAVAHAQIDSIVVAPIVPYPKASSTGQICSAPTVTTPMPLALGNFNYLGGNLNTSIQLDFGACDEKALYNVTFNLSDGTGLFKTGSYTKLVHP
jgi:cytolysin (calcineurin-like family phosphatase)